MLDVAIQRRVNEREERNTLWIHLYIQGLAGKRLCRCRFQEDPRSMGRHDDVAHFGTARDREQEPASRFLDASDPGAGPTGSIAIGYEIV